MQLAERTIRLADSLSPARRHRISMGITNYHLLLDNFVSIQYISAVGLRQFFTSQLLIYRPIDK